MYFKEWAANEIRVERLVNRLTDCGVDFTSLVSLIETDVRDAPKSLFSTLRKRFGKLFANQELPKKEDSNKKTDTPQEKLRNLNDQYNDLMTKWNPEYTLRKHCRRGIDGVEWCRAPWVKPSDQGTPGNPYTYGFISKEEYVKQWKQITNNIKNQIDSLYKVKESPVANVENNSDKVAQARNAIETLKKILKDPKFEPLLNSLEQEVELMGKPSYYHNMSSGEKSWYDKLGDVDRRRFDDEMGRSGNQNINYGDHWWDIASSRAQKAAQQGYQDADANWKWAAGFANRQRIRSSMNPDWENELQGESTTTGGNLFREWLRKRIAEDNSVPNNQPSQVINPTNPKDAERRQELNKITSNMMLKNKQLIPGNTKDQSMVVNAIRSDPKISKMDPKTQQDVSSFFLKQPNSN